MYINSAYWNNSRIDFKDKKKPLFVGSCGSYRLIRDETLPTHRPKGRLDFQLLYVASGKAHFYFSGNEEVVTAGHMVIYRPKEEQRYYYYGSDKPEVFWVHFTGNEAKTLLRGYGISDSVHTIYTGITPLYSRLFNMMIQELQVQMSGYEDMLILLLRQILILVHRHINFRPNPKNTFLENEIDRALKYFYDNSNQPISVNTYASSRGMSTSWFIRSFREYTNVTPMQYILSLRMNNAQNLLESTEYSIAEISNIIGYENPLYFSRLFRKQCGITPTEFRKKIRQASAVPN